MSLRLDAEKVGVRGATSGRSATRVLSGTKLNALEVVVREAIQNSWDARNNGKIAFGLKAYRFTPSQRTAALAALQDGFVSKDPLLGQPPLPLQGLVLYDRGTTGLDGPTVAGGVEEGNFERFFFGFGETKPQPGKLAAGGTYGFGRSSFLRCSALHTILVHTRCKPESGTRRESRFIGMTFVDGYVRKEHKFSGRHWWVKSGQEFGPVTGSAADALARSLGMPIPSNDDTGSTILILQPRWALAASDEEETETGELGAARELILESLLWNTWPHVADRSMALEVEWFGDQVSVPDPAKHPRLGLFVRALDIAKKKKVSRTADRHATISCLRPIQTLGSLGLVRAPHVATGAASGRSYLPAEDPLHHVALMRGAQLIVKYMECANPIEGEQYAGVFLVDQEVDATFAKSEPAAHDEWLKKDLDDWREKRYVSVALKRIEEEARAYVTPEGADITGEAGNLAGIAEELGTLLPAFDGDGAGGWKPQPGGGAGGGAGAGGGGKPGSRRPSVLLMPANRRSDGDWHVLEVPFELGPRAQTTVLEASVSVMVDGGREDEPPAGATSPYIVGWLLGDDGSTLR